MHIDICIYVCVCAYIYTYNIVVQSLHRVQLFETLWTTTHLPSLSFTLSWNLLKLMSIVGSPRGSDCKESSSDVGDLGLILDWADPLEQGMVSCSSVLAWRIPWTEEPGGL